MSHPRHFPQTYPLGTSEEQSPRSLCLLLPVLGEPPSLCCCFICPCKASALSFPGAPSAIYEVSQGFFRDQKETEWSSQLLPCKCLKTSREKDSPCSTENQTKSLQTA